MVHHDGRTPEHVGGQGVWVDTDGTPTGNSMWHHLWSPGCYRNSIAHPALHDSAWGTQHIGRSLAP